MSQVWQLPASHSVGTPGHGLVPTDRRKSRARTALCQAGHRLERRAAGHLGELVRSRGVAAAHGQVDDPVIGDPGIADALRGIRRGRQVGPRDQEVHAALDPPVGEIVHLSDHAADLVRALRKVDRDVNLVRPGGDEAIERIAMEEEPVGRERAEEGADELLQNVEQAGVLERLAAAERHGLDPVRGAIADEPDDLIHRPPGFALREAVVVTEPARLGAAIGQLDGDQLEGHGRIMVTWAPLGSPLVSRQAPWTAGISPGQSRSYGISNNWAASLTLPVRNPWRNQNWRCLDVPWVNESGWTRPRASFCR